MIGHPPDVATTPIPEKVRELACGRPTRPVWLNEAGGLTFEIDGDDEGRCFIKWQPAGQADLQPEARRLRWARRYAAVPAVLDEGHDEHGSWLVTTPVPGTSAVAPRWVKDPATAAAAIGRGLRALHNTLPIADCPFTWSVTDRVADAHQRRPALDPSTWHHVHRGLSVDAALETLEQPPSIDRLVVCHGDACAPNTLIDDSGLPAGHVDLGALGVADRWADLAVATWSVDWNYGPGWAPTLLESYGVQPDNARTAYYRLLWDLGP